MSSIPTEKDVQQSLMVERYQRTFCLPNYTPNQWWECDVFELTDADLFVEYEIKLTLSDFKADAQKAKDVWIPGDGIVGWSRQNRVKHQCIGRPEGPSRFYYVAPAGLLSAVPEWAGLIEFTERPDHRAPYKLFIGITKKAPRLHSQKIDPKVKDHAHGIAYWRFHSLFLHGKSSMPAETSLETAIEKGG